MTITSPSLLWWVPAVGHGVDVAIVFDKHDTYIGLVQTRSIWQGSDHEP